MAMDTYNTNKQDFDWQSVRDIALAAKDAASTQSPENTFKAMTANMPQTAFVQAVSSKHIAGFKLISNTLV